MIASLADCQAWHAEYLDVREHLTRLVVVVELPPSAPIYDRLLDRLCFLTARLGYVPGEPAE